MTQNILNIKINGEMRMSKDLTYVDFTRAFQRFLIENDYVFDGKLTEIPLDNKKTA